MDLFYLLDVITEPNMCTALRPVWTIFGYIIWAIKIVVPLLLIISGMITMAQAIMKKDEKDIKAAQNFLVKKLIAAVIVYLIITAVGMVVGLVSKKTDYKTCAHCAFHPFDSEAGCGIILDDPTEQ